MRSTTAYALLLLVATLLAACSPRPVVETPPPGAVETVVQMTLASQPTFTPVPSDTPAPVEPTASPVVETATPETTGTPTASPTPLSSDPAVALGEPSTRDTLDSGSGFGISSDGYEDDATRMFLDNGALVVESKSTGGWTGWRLRPPKVENFYLQGTFQARNCAGNDIFGLVFRAPDFESGDGYYFGVSCDGRYSLSRRDEGGAATVNTGSALPAFTTGAGQTNRLGVLANGSKLTLYVNGQPVAEVEDDALGEAGYFGTFVSGQSGGLSVALDEIAVWPVQ